MAQMLLPKSLRPVSYTHLLEDQGVSHGMKKKSLNCSAIAASIREEYPQTAWVSARTEGTRLVITVKEGDFQNKKKKEKVEPCNLTATESGTVVKIITRAGVPRIRPGENCKTGDVLVSGCLELKNDSQEVTRYEYVHADADIYIKRKLSYYAELPLELSLIHISRKGSCGNRGSQ